MLVIAVEAVDRLGHARILAFVGCALAFLAVGQSRASDWPQWRGPNRNGVSSETGWLTNWPPRVVWSNTIEIGESCVSISDGRLYTMGRWSDSDRSVYSNVVYCLDAATGAKLWTQTYLTDFKHPIKVDYGTLSTPTVGGGELYVFDDNGMLSCFDKVTGSNLWQESVDLGMPDYGYASSPLLEGDLVILNIDGVAVAVSRTTHKIVWQSGNASRKDVYSSPVPILVGTQRVVLVQDRGALNMVNPADGSLLWTTSYPFTPSFSMGDPVLYGGDIYAYEGKCRLQPAPDMSGVTQVWANNITVSQYPSTPVVVGDYAYVLWGLSAKGWLTCVDLRSGATMWSTNGFGHMNAPGGLIAADGKLIVFAYGKLRVVKANPTVFDEEGRTNVVVGSASDVLNYGFVPPVLCNGRIYCRFKDKLVCYQAGPNPPADTNYNGIADAWEAKYFTNTCDVAADPDGDGASNRAEYLADTDPTDELSCPRASIAQAGANVVVSCPTVASGGTNYLFRTRYYGMEQADGLTTTGAWQGVSGLTDILGTGDTLRLTNAVSGSNRFYRVSVRLD